MGSLGEFAEELSKVGFKANFLRDSHGRGTKDVVNDIGESIASKHYLTLYCWEPLVDIGIWRQFILSETYTKYESIKA